MSYRNDRSGGKNKMTQFDFIEMKIPAKPAYVGVVRLTISGIASRMGFSYEVIEDLKIALSEAVTNVVAHAYEKEDRGEVRIGFGVYEDKIEMMVADQGESFNFEDVKNRIGPMNQINEMKPVTQMREGGFGLYLINALMDKVEINNEYGVVVLMTKFLDETGVEIDDKVQTTK